MIGERRFRRTVLLTALASQCAYAIAADKAGLAFIALLTTVLSWWLVRQTLAGKPHPIPRTILNGLVILAIFHLLYQLLNRTQEVITCLTDFLAYVMLVKSLDRNRMRDEAQLLGLSLFVVIGALLTGQSLMMGLALVAYTPLGIMATVSLQLYAARERQRDLLKLVGLDDQAAAVDAQLERQHAPRAAAVLAGACVVASMATGVAAFVITPRQLAQQLGMAAAPFVKSPTTEFSDQINLGQSGNISQDNTPVMDVRTISEPGTVSVATGPIYLRGAVLTDYDDKHFRWTGVGKLTDENGQIDPANEARAPKELTPVKADRARNRTRYEIIQRSTKANQNTPLFAPLQPVVVATDAPGKIHYRKADAIMWLSPGSTGGGGRLVYTVTSVSDYREPPTERQPRAITKERPPANDEPVERARPSASEPITRLARRLLAEKSIPPDPAGAGPLEVRRAAQAMIAHLGTFEYSLEMMPADGDPIETFLFKNKRGHCEYFAAAMVKMLNGVGVTARIATGYVAAEYNSVSGYYTVRKSDAHAWVEVQMEPGRWDTFDPTPPGDLQSTKRASGGPIAWLKHLWDAVEFSWLDNVVAYDKGLKLDVIGLAGKTDPGETAVKWQQRFRTWQGWVRRHLPESVAMRSIVVGLVTFGAVLAGYWVVRLGGRSAGTLRKRLLVLLTGRRPGQTEPPPMPADAAFYGDALSILAQRGSPKPAATPPLTFADALAADAAVPFRVIASLYYRSRFGESPLDARQREQGLIALSELRAALGSGGRAQPNRPRT